MAAPGEGNGRRHLRRTASAGALFRITNLRDIDVDGDRAVLHKKFAGTIAKPGGETERLRWQTLYFCQRAGGVWKILGFVGYMPNPLGSGQ